MKQRISIFTFFILTISYGLAQAHAQTPAVAQANSNAFTVIDMKINASNYLIVTCRDDLGRTIQFYTGKSDPITLGLTTLPNFARGTVSPDNNKNSNYVILKPVFSNQCCSISKIEYGVNNQPVDFVIAKEDTANGLTYFNKNSSPAVTVKIKQPIYQKVFNNKRYAILKPLDERELNKNIFYSYEFKFMTHELYNSLHKNVNENNIIANNKDPVKAETNDGKTLEYNDTISQTAQTQKLNTDTNIVINNNPVSALSVAGEKKDTIIHARNEDPVFRLPLHDSARFEKLNTDTNIVSNKNPAPGLIFHKEKADTGIVAANKDPISSLPSVNSGHTEITEIMFGKNMATGILHIDIPDDVECVINIYSVPDHTLLYNSIQQRSFSLLPGMYDIEISGVSVKNIPVNKAMDTRIKTGVLSITLNGPWTLYDKDKIKALYNSSQPKKLGLPAGIYQLEFNGALNKVEIKDHDILNYDTSREVVVQTQTTGIADSTKNITVNAVVPNSLPGDKKWEIKQNVSVKGNTGRIVLSIPKEIESIITITQPVSGKEVYYSGILTKERSFSLPPGNYDVKVSGYIIKNVPVQKGMDTKIKAGVLEVTAPGIWTLYDEKKDKQVYFSTSEKKIGLPAGIYQLEINGIVNQVTIKDGETVKF